MKLITESTGEVPEAVPGLQLNILAVVFADGTYEGDPIPAARLRAYKLGEKIQLTRILTLFRSKSATYETLATKVDDLPYAISESDVSSLSAVFPGMPPAELENWRSAAEVSAHDIQKDLRKTFGEGSTIDPQVFSNAVKGAIAKCEKWLNALP